MGMNFFKITAIGILQCGAHIRRRLLTALVHQINQRQRRLAFGQIVADIFADLFGVAGIVQHIVNNLEGRADIHTVIPQRGLLLC